jgi:hypothetical protein
MVIVLNINQKAVTSSWGLPFDIIPRSATGYRLLPIIPPFRAKLAATPRVIPESALGAFVADSTRAGKSVLLKVNCPVLASYQQSQ